MTREEAIEIIENGGWWDLLIPVTTIEGRIEEDKLHEALDMALSALTPPNEPLTFAQLCEMDGNPVFAVIGGIEPLKMWTLIEFVEEAYCVILTNNLGGRTEYYSDKELKEDGLTIYRYPPEEKKNASPDLISRSALLEGETEPEITTGSDSELAEQFEWRRWMDKIKRAPAVGKEEES